MKLLILNSDYPEFLRALYAEHDGLERQPYAEQLHVRNESLFSVADFYSSNLIKFGHEAQDIHVNNEDLQRAWARENGFSVPEVTQTRRRAKEFLQRARRGAAKTPLRHLKALFRPVLRMFCDYQILAAQIRRFRPDILINQVMSDISCGFLREMKPHIRLLIGNHAATRLSSADDWSCYDLVVSSYPPTVDWFRGRGLPAEFNPLCFEPRVLSYLRENGKSIDVSFVGSLFNVHSERTDLLEHLCETFGMRIWAPDVHGLRRNSPVRRCYMGQAWGRQMYQVLRDSKITVNHHGNIGPYANNLRLFEATGVGTLLITDWKRNLHEIFKPGSEVVAYENWEQCLDRVGYYLTHREERDAIARAGQGRTLREHTYCQRIQELLAIIERQLARVTASRKDRCADM